MSASVVDTLVAKCQRPGEPAILEVKNLSVEQASSLASALAPLQIHARVIDGAHLSGKADLLRELAKAFAFPSYFGQNWDALLDCWSDLSWLPGRGWICILQGADALHAIDAKAHDTLLGVCRDAAQRWHDHDPKAVFKMVRVAGPLPTA
jgi:hypothetical protein